MLTDWMAGKMIRLGYVAPLDDSKFPNRGNVAESVRNVDFDPGRKYTVPWVSGMTGIGYNPKKTGREITSINDIFDPKFKGKVTMLTEMRDTFGLVMLGLGKDPTHCTVDDVKAAAAKIKQARLSGQIRSFTGNDYADDLASGNILIAFAWSGDIQGLAADNPDLKWVAPKEGAMMYSDNMMIPKTSDRQDLAMAWINWCYDPAHSAQIVSGAPYISDVNGRHGRAGEDRFDAGQERPRESAGGAAWPGSTCSGRCRTTKTRSSTASSRTRSAPEAAWRAPRLVARDGIRSRPTSSSRRACCGSSCSSWCPSRPSSTRPSPGRARRGGTATRGRSRTTAASCCGRSASRCSRPWSPCCSVTRWRTSWRSGPGRFKNFLLGLVILPFFTTFLVRTFAWKTILNDGGPIVGLFVWLHLVPPDGRLLNTNWAVIGGLTYNFLPFMILPIYVSLEKIDRRLVEAAQDLYSSPGRAFGKVVLPLSLPGVFAGSLLTFIPASGDFINAELLGSPNQRMIGTVIQNQFLQVHDYPLAAALSFVLMIIISIAVIAYARVLGTEELA